MPWLVGGRCEYCSIHFGLAIGLREARREEVNKAIVCVFCLGYPNISEIIRVWISAAARVRPRLSESPKRLSEWRGHGLEGNIIVCGGGGSPSLVSLN